MPLSCRGYTALSSDEAVINGSWEKYGKFVSWSILRCYPDICDTSLSKSKSLQTEKPSSSWTTEQSTFKRCRICMIFSFDYEDSYVIENKICKKNQ